MYLFPSIDLRDGQVVRLFKGDYDQQTTYGDDPLGQAKRFADAGATWLHVVDLDGARSGVMAHRDAIARICRDTALNVEVGGGVRDEATVRDLLQIGVTRVVLGTAALENWPWFETLVQQADLANRLVLGLDVRKGRVAVSGWETQLDASATEIARRVNGWPLAAIVFTDIAVDGTLEGPNLASTRDVADATDVPVVASGGVGTLDHLIALRDLPIQGAIVGRALYERTFTIDEALATFER